MSDDPKREETPVTPGEPQSIWFFVGMILTLYGLIVLVTGLFGHAPATVMGETRPAIWWGAIMTVFGVIFLKVGWRSAADRAELTGEAEE